jgi:hypothetical protein
MMTITRYSKILLDGGIFGGEEVNRQNVSLGKGLNNIWSITYGMQILAETLKTLLLVYW